MGLTVTPASGGVDGQAINPTSTGATTPGTGAFTTLSCTSGGTLAINTLTSNQVSLLNNGVKIEGGQYLYWNGRNALSSLADEKLLVTNAAATKGYVLKCATNGTLAVRNIDDSADGALTCGDATSSGNLILSAVGKGLQIKGGTGSHGQSVTLVGGTKTVTNTTITNNSHFAISGTALGGTPGSVEVIRSSGAGYTINSSNPLDTSTFDVMIYEVN